MIGYNIITYDKSLNVDQSNVERAAEPVLRMRPKIE